MRPMGGELELSRNNYQSYFTDSGRSSLRLFLRSGKNNKKVYLLPDFFCGIIEQIFIEEDISYSFYPILEDLTIDLHFIKKSKFDVLYIINYFGQIQDLSALVLNDKILLEDNVFHFNFENHSNVKNWYSFNSFRKISSLPDGSLIKTTLKIDKGLIQNKIPPFTQKKILGKYIKREYLIGQDFSEQDYLREFQAGENILNEQKEIYLMTDFSSEKLLSLDINYEQAICKARYLKLYKIIKKNYMGGFYSHYSFFILKLKNRDKFRKHLMEKNIFLPIHWPETTQKNIIYQQIISIPLFAQYTNNEFSYMLKQIKAALKATN